ncbi:secretin N-terminal domain-containing protein [Candidatus Omnitrophota bacterium]
MHKTCSKKFTVLALMLATFLFWSLTVGAQEATFEEISEDGGTQEAQSQEEEVYIPGLIDMSQRITLDLRNMGVTDALKYISLRAGLNVVTSKSVTGRVTFQLKNVPIQDIFDITLISNTLAYEKIGDIYYVMTEKEYETRYGRKFGDTRVVKVFRLNYAVPEKAFDMIETLKSKIGKVLVDQDTGTVLMMDTPDRIREVERSLKALEQKTDISIFNLQYADATEVEEQLQAQLDDKKVGSIRADERTNQVIVQTLPGRMGEVEKIINELDRKTKAVLIDTKIIKIQLTDDYKFGFEWEGMFEGMSRHGMNFLGSHPLEPVFRAGQSFVDQFTSIAEEDDNLPAGSKITSTEKVYFGRTSSSFSFETAMEFLQTFGETRILSNPKLSVVNNQEARIHVGRREAYITTTTTTGQTTTTTAEEVTFVDIGIQLAVTPTINDEGFITMKIKPEISSVVDTLVTPSGNEIPIIDTSTAETTVLVKDNSTIIIGGLRREEEVFAKEGIPFLSSIPLIGNLFGKTSTDKTRTELLIMITPTIVRGDKFVTGEVEPGQKGSKPYKEYIAFESVEEEEVELHLKPYSTY